MATAKSNTHQNTTKRNYQWPLRYGKITNLYISSGRNGPFAIMTMDCTKFNATVSLFGEELVEQVKAAGEGAFVSVAGPINPVRVKNESGNYYTEDRMKCLYFKNNSDTPAAKANKKTASATAPKTPTKSPAKQNVVDAEHAF